MKLLENKLKEKLDSHLIPETCTEIRATFKIKNYHSGGQRPHPYKHGHNRPFLGQTPFQYRQRGSYSGHRGRGKPWNQKGVGKFRGVESLTARNLNAEPKEVRDSCDSVPGILEELQKQSEDFRAGQIRFCLAQWKQITIHEEFLSWDGRWGWNRFRWTASTRKTGTTINFPQNKYILLMCRNCWRREW